MQTPFVAQCFAPAWHAAHSYQLRLTSSMLEALATQVGDGEHAIVMLPSPSVPGSLAACKGRHAAASPHLSVSHIVLCRA